MSDKLLRISGVKRSASDLLDGGEAWLKMRQIIKAQGGNPNVKVDDLKLGKLVLDFKTKSSGKVSKILNKSVVVLTRMAGAPNDKEAGVYFHKKVGDTVVKGDVLFTVYSNHDEKFSDVSDWLKFNKVVLL